MYRSLLLLGFLSIPLSCFGQSTPTESQTLQALLNEVRQLRQDLQTTTAAAQRAQILLYRVQAQESIVRRVQERVDNTQSKLTQTQTEEKRLATALKQYDDSSSRDENPANQKEIEQVIAGLKSGLEIQSANEQEEQTKLTEAQEELRIEQAKLAELEDHLELLEKALENRQAVNNPR